MRDVVADDPFRLAFLRIKQADGLYSEEPTGVQLLSPEVFRTSFRIPAAAPVGTYEFTVKLFADGHLLASASTSVVVRKSGFGQQIAALAEDHGFLYGLCVACGAARHRPRRQLRLPQGLTAPGHLHRPSCTPGVKRGDTLWR